MSIAINRRLLSHAEIHDIDVQGPEAEYDQSSSEGVWQTISARSGLNISVFDVTNSGETIDEPVNTAPCVSLIFLFGGGGESWLQDENDVWHGPVSHRPGRLYFMYAPTPTRGTNEAPHGIRFYGLDIRISIEIWHRIVGENPAFELTPDHPYHLVTCGESWFGLLPVGPEIRRNARQIFDAAMAQDSDLIVESRSLELIDAVHNCLLQVPAHSSAFARDRRVVETVRQRMMEALDHNWSVAELAAEAGVSLKRLKSVFPAHTGLPVYQYLQEARLIEAHRLFREGGHRVTDVALSVGYDSVSHFSALFRRRFGVSPTQL